jgi:putative ABC transport system permease protein
MYWLDRLRHDVRYGLRGLLRNPGFTAVAVIALALGIGANSAIFSAVNAILLRPLAYRDSERLVVILNHGRGPVAPANFIDWKAQSRSFENMGAAEFWTPDLTNTDVPEKLWATRVTSDIFPTLGVEPALGRTFTKSEEQVGNEYEVVLSHGLWQRQFAGDRGVLGRRIQLDGKTYTVVGVMPPGFKFALFWANQAELWAPLALGARTTSRGGNSLRVFARLSPGVTLDQARAEFAGITARLELQYPGTNKDARIVPFRERVVGTVRPALLTLLFAVGFVLLIACANVAHMLLARGAARGREVAVRVALGAGRARLIGQFLTESLLLALTGGALGLLLAYCGIRAMVRFGPPGIPRLETLSLDWRVLAFTLAASLATGAAFGLAPALQASQFHPSQSLKESGRGAGGDGTAANRLRRALVAAEFALTLILLAGAGLMLRTFVALETVDPGFQSHNLLTMVVSVGGTKNVVRTQEPAFYQALLERVRGVPGVESAGLTNHLPIAGDIWGWPFWVEGKPIPHPGEEPDAAFRLALPGYLETMRMRILRGRPIEAGDTQSAPAVVVINEYMAQKHWPAEDAIGKRIALKNPSAGQPRWVTVVGVVKNAVRSELAAPAEEEFFLPYLQHSGDMGHYMTLVVRTPGDPVALSSTVKDAVWELDRNVTISEVQTMDSVVELANAQPRFNMALLMAFALVAMVLSAVGIYGVMSYAVTRRRQEISIRMALGARRSDVLRMIVKQGMSPAFAGAALGAIGALALTRLMTRLLYQVQPTDPATFITVPCILLAVALCACLIPARRAAQTSPITALRHE